MTFNTAKIHTEGEIAATTVIPLRFRHVYTTVYPMNSSGKIPHNLQTLATLAKRLLSLYIESAKLTAAEKLTVIMSAGVLLIVTLVLGVFALAFLSGACIELLALVLPAWASYAILGALFLLLGILTLTLKKQLVIDPIARFVSKLVFDSNHNHTED